MRKLTTRITAVLLTLLCVGALASCTAIPNLVSSPSGETLPPAIDSDRFKKILQDIDQVSKTGDATRDSNQLTSRFLNPALRMRNGEYAQVNATNGTSLAALPLTDPQAMIVGEAKEFPRYTFSVSPVKSGQSIYVFAFSQSQPRANYGLWGWVKLFPKVKFPATFKPEVSSPAVPPDSQEHVIAPGQVAAKYAELMNNPDAPAKTEFDTRLDAFLANYYSHKQQYAQIAAQTRGIQFNLSAAAGNDAMVALKTADGGALVMTTLNYTVEMTSPHPLENTNLAKLYTGKKTASSTLKEHHTVSVLFLVPSKASKNKITVLGAANSITMIEAD